MSFKDDYTTSDLVLTESSILDYSKASSEIRLEKDKIILSNNFYMLGQMLETLTNTMRNK